MSVLIFVLHRPVEKTAKLEGHKGELFAESL
jgi:hypothetical protein